MPTVANQARSTLELDLQRRLLDLPRTAMVRGVFFRIVRDEMAKRGLGAGRDLADILRHKDAWRLYPARELMTAYAMAAPLFDADPNQGLRSLWFGHASGYSKTWYGQLLRKFLGDDPGRALRYVERARERVANFGMWRLETVGPRHLVLHMFDEYFWIESAQRGGCEGLLEACNVKGEVRAELDSAYRGFLEITWDPPQRY